MTQVAALGTQKIDLISLIKNSPSLTEEKRQFWLDNVRALTPAQQQELAQIFLDEQAQITVIQTKREEGIREAGLEFVEKANAEGQKAKKEMWRATEELVKTSEDKEEINILNQVKNV